MSLKGPEHITCEVLVIGGGGAGLRASIQARKRGASVLLVSKSRIGMGNNTILSKATFAGATGLGDSLDKPEVHIQDTLEAGRFINESKLVKRMADSVLEEVYFLENCGVSFQKTGESFTIDKVPGHTYPRHVFGQNRRGNDLILPLKRYAANIGVRFLDRIFITRLLSTGHGISVTGIDKEGRLLVFQASAVIMATGGFAQIYLNTNNAPGATGDGYALAFHLGIPLRDMEFVQFYPTSLGIKLIPYEVFIDIYKAPLRNAHGEDVVKKYGLKEHMIMTRDRLSRAIMREILEGRAIEGGVTMDLSSILEKEILRHSNFLPREVLSGKRELTVRPTAHFAMGGINIDKEAHTSFKGLFACGEICGGIHGANRLAGNALAEVFTIGRVAGDNAALLAREVSPVKADHAMVMAEKMRLESFFGESTMSLKDLARALKEIAWYQIGIIRQEQGLMEALEKIKELRSQAEKTRIADMRGLSKLLELKNMLLVAEMVSYAALERCESRGAHYREDYPEEDPSWNTSLFVLNKSGEITVNVM